MYTGLIIFGIVLVVAVITGLFLLKKMSRDEARKYEKIK